MTEAEKKLSEILAQGEKKAEELRQLSVRVAELKAQNEQFDVENGRIKQAIPEYQKKEEDAKLAYQDAQNKREGLEGILIGLSAKVEEAKATLHVKENASAELQIKIDELTVKFDELSKSVSGKETELGDLVDKIKAASESMDAKYESLKGFESELLKQQALLARRAADMDLEEKGVKVK